MPVKTLRETQAHIRKAHHKFIASVIEGHVYLGTKFEFMRRTLITYKSCPKSREVELVEKGSRKTGVRWESRVQKYN